MILFYDSYSIRISLQIRRFFSIFFPKFSNLPIFPKFSNQKFSNLPLSFVVEIATMPESSSKGSKKNGKFDLGNYKPISILSSVNKIFETILLKRSVDFWEKYTLFTNYQFGFRKLHSTNLAITYLHETILKERDVNNSV